MAVYTTVGDAELAAFLKGYDLGEPLRLQGVAEGVENSNFILDTTAGRYVLTLYERRVREADLPFYLGLMSWAADRAFPCPRPQPSRTGALLSRLNGRPAAVTSFLPGRADARPGAALCFSAGAACARLHAAAAGFPDRRANALGLASWRPLWTAHRAVAKRLRPGLTAVIDGDLQELEAAWPGGLPSGAIHADLFPDNVFFDTEGGFAGAIDFYFACTDALAYDLAVMIVAWAVGEAGALDGERAAALVAGYASERALAPAERAALPMLVRGAALRFFLTRLADWDTTPADALVTRKDPLEYADKLAAHRSAAADPPPAWILAE